ncbi:SPOR domain-containing protein, partial [Endozoicomonas sp. ONNA2]|uniref:SPOR domain-containing protein n=1 Tax=Endozoicomonas sp. ONNA2 TaxID=2828741 RepID=UPI002147B91B
VAESLVLPPKPLASNITWNCQSGINNDWLCNGISRQVYKTEPAPQYADYSRQQPDAQKLYAESRNSLSSIEARNSASLASILDAPRDHYVLQWMAAKERQQLEALKQRYQVLKDATIAEYQRSGTVWYVLLDGPYPSHIAAMAALDSPPRSHMARELYPWTRSLASIHKLDINRPKYPVEQLAQGNQPEYPPEPSMGGSNNAPINYDISYSTTVADGTEQKHQRTQYQPHYAQQTQSETSVIPRNNGYPPAQAAYDKRQSADRVPYGSEFEGMAYSGLSIDQNYRVLPEQANPQEMYVSISPAYRSSIPQQHTPASVDYNAQNQAVSPAPEYRKPRSYDEPEQPRHSINVLTANPKSYTIEWMNANRKASLERARLRYSELQNTQIIHYQRNSRSRYALVSMLFVNRSEALDALLTPSLSRVSARFSPKVRQVAYLQSLVGSTRQAARAWANPVTERIEPSANKRHWTNQDDPGDKTYIVHREDLDRQPEKARLRNSHDSHDFGTPTMHQQTVVHAMPNSDQPAQTGHQQDNNIEQPDNHSHVNALLNSPDDSYTIQWFAASNWQTIDKLKRRFPELASAVTVHVKRNQKDWYVLVQGQYRSSKEAMRALKSPAMKNIALILHPWTRPVASLKKLQIASL